MKRPENPIHIAFIVTRDDTVGDATVHVRDMALSLLDRGHRASVLMGAPSVGDTDEVIDELQRHNIPCQTVDRLRRGIHPWHDLMAILELKRTLSHIQPDLVSTHTPKASLLGRIAARAAGIPAILTSDGWTITDRTLASSGRLSRLAEFFTAPLKPTPKTDWHARTR